MSEADKANRRQKLQEALHESARTPLAIATNAAGLLADLIAVIEGGSRHILSDAEIAVLLAEATVAAALVNVRVNLPMIRDSDAVASFVEQMAAVESQAAVSADRCRLSLARRRAASGGI